MNPPASKREPIPRVRCAAAAPFGKRGQHLAAARMLRAGSFRISRTRPLCTSQARLFPPLQKGGGGDLLPPPQQLPRVRYATAASFQKAGKPPLSSASLRPARPPPRRRIERKGIRHDPQARRPPSPPQSLAPAV